MKLMTCQIMLKCVKTHESRLVLKILSCTLSGILKNLLTLRNQQNLRKHLGKNKDK